MNIGPFLLPNRFDVALNQGFYLVDKRSGRGTPVEGLAETGTREALLLYPIKVPLVSDSQGPPLSALT